MTSFLRTVALTVLLIGALQIAMCAVDCDCFLPPSAGISSRSASGGDADGCLCCAQAASVGALVEIPSPFFAELAPPRFVLQGQRQFALFIDRPPRS